MGLSSDKPSLLGDALIYIKEFFFKWPNLPFKPHVASVWLRGWLLEGAVWTKLMSGHEIEMALNEGTVSAFEVRKGLLSHIETMEALCTALEELADELPSNLNKQRALYVARTMYAVVCRVHHYEEKIVFPFLEKKLFKNPTIKKTLTRLRAEHWEDESFAVEIHEALLAFIAQSNHQESEKLGYMLRGFFEGMRRHLAFEKEHIMPLLTEIN